MIEPGGGGTAAVLDAIARAIAARQPNRGVGVLVCAPRPLDLVNHLAGYAAGDEAIGVVEHRLAMQLATVGARSRPAELVRFVGHQFVAVVPDLVARRDLDRVAERLVSALDYPVRLDDGSQWALALTTGASATFDASPEAADLLRVAALNRSAPDAAGGGSAPLVADGGDDLDRRARLELRRDLRLAMNSDQFLLHHQPVVDLATGRIDHVEALVRWRHPRRGLLLPATFLSLARDESLIDGVGRIVLAAAVREAAHWQRRFDRLLPVSVNVEPGQLDPERLPAAIERVVGEAGLPAASLRLEVPESGLIGADGAIVDCIGALVEHGVIVAVDGARGDAAVADTVAEVAPGAPYKMHPSLGHSDNGGPHDHAARGVVEAARKLGLELIATGLEDEHRLDAARARGIRLGQGFALQRPVGAERIEPTLTVWRSSAVRS